MTDSEVTTQSYLEEMPRKDPFLGGSVLESLKQILPTNPSIKNVFFYTWAEGSDTETQPVQMTDGKEYNLVLPKNQNTNLISLTRSALQAPELTDASINAISRLPNEYISLSSRVELDDGREAFIPMMDADLPKTQPNLTILSIFSEALARRLAYRGKFLLFESTHSYYIMGTQILEQGDWLNFLSICSLATIQTSDQKSIALHDTPFAGYTLLKKGDNGLRLTNGDVRSETPKVVKVVSGQKSF